MIFSQTILRQSFKSSLFITNKQWYIHRIFAKNVKIKYNASTTRHSQSQKTNNHSKLHHTIKVWPLEGLILSVIKEKNLENCSINENKFYQIAQNQQIEIIQKYLEKQDSQSPQFTNIVINSYFSTIQYLPFQNSQKEIKQLNPETFKIKQAYKNLIQTLNQSKNWKFVSNFQNVLDRHQKRNFQHLILCIGDYNDALMKHFPTNSYVTLQQMCAIFPEKVPLSYRKKQVTEDVRTFVEQRLNRGRIHKLSLKQEPKFDEIIIINDKIKMWDEAYQVMLDEMPTKITIPFHISEPSLKFYRINLTDFVNGFKTCHLIIHPKVQLSIQHQNIEEFLKELLINSSMLNHLKNSTLQINKDLFKDKICKF